MQKKIFITKLILWVTFGLSLIYSMIGLLICLTIFLLLTTNKGWIWSANSLFQNLFFTRFFIMKDKLTDLRPSSPEFGAMGTIKVRECTDVRYLKLEGKENNMEWTSYINHANKFGYVKALLICKALTKRNKEDNIIYSIIPVLEQKFYDEIRGKKF